ncbi:MAG: hypothetical protein J5637_00205 [Prevotella sp.]|nr:hypothetical protein [Prevotella sp.]
MRKLLFSFAIAVVTVAMVSCSNKAAQDETVDGEDTTAVEEGVPAQQEVAIEDQTELDCPNYTIKVPEGWKARSRMVNNSCVIGYKEPPFTTASPDFNSMGMDAYKAELEKQGFQSIDDITANGNTFNVFYTDKTKDNTQVVYIAIPKGEGLVTVKLSDGAHKMDKLAAKEALLNHAKIIAQNITLK